MTDDVKVMCDPQGACPSSAGNVRLISVSCGSQNVWAVDGRGLVYFRVGTQPLNPSMMLPAWILIEPPAQVGPAFSYSIYTHCTCANTLTEEACVWCSSLWGCSWSRSRPAPMTNCCGYWTTGAEFMSGPDSAIRCQWGPTGSQCQVDLRVTEVDRLVVVRVKGFTLSLSGLAVSHLVLSSRTVWVRCPNGEIARRYGVSERNPAGDYWKKIPGTAHWLTGKTEGTTGPFVSPSASPVRLTCLS